MYWIIITTILDVKIKKFQFNIAALWWVYCVRYMCVMRVVVRVTRRCKNLQVIFVPQYSCWISISHWKRCPKSIWRLLRTWKKMKIKFKNIRKTDGTASVSWFRYLLSQGHEGESVGPGKLATLVLNGHCGTSRLSCGGNGPTNRNFFHKKGRKKLEFHYILKYFWILISVWNMLWLPEKLFNYMQFGLAFFIDNHNW